jgi:hypothetical protein
MLKLEQRDSIKWRKGLYVKYSIAGPLASDCQSVYFGAHYVKSSECVYCGVHFIKSSECLDCGTHFIKSSDCVCIVGSTSSNHPSVCVLRGPPHQIIRVCVYCGAHFMKSSECVCIVGPLHQIIRVCVLLWTSSNHQSVYCGAHLIKPSECVLRGPPHQIIRVSADRRFLFILWFCMIAQSIRTVYMYCTFYMRTLFHAAEFAIPCSK